MKLVRFRCEGQVRHGILEHDSIQCTGDPLAGSLTPDGPTVPLADVELLHPVDPPNIICIGLNYREHAIESGAAIPTHPAVFCKLTTAAIPPAAPIRLPRLAPDCVDYEAELALVIGKTAREVPECDFAEYVLGYTCANDVSARDCQKHLDVQWTRAKSFDTFCPFGPHLETDLDPGNLRVRSRVNGEPLQDSTTADMIFPVPALVSFLSHCFTLRPGTLILTGTPPGVGMARTPPRYLRPGDTVEIEVQGIGVLTNPVLSPGGTDGV